MKKLLIVLFILVSVFSFSLGLFDEISFFDYYLDTYTDLSDSVINAFVERLLVLYMEGILDYSYVSPLDLLVLMEVETSFRNIVGDSGDSFGYFQIQQEAYFYVRNFVQDPYVPVVSWTWDEVKPLIKFQITVASLYLQYMRMYNLSTSWEYFTKYNGDSEESLLYLHKVSNAYSNISLMYYEYLKEN